MDITEYNYIWESEKNNWVLVNTSFGYSIVNKFTKSALLVSDDDLEQAIINNMLNSGNKIYDNINDAYADT